MNDVLEGGYADGGDGGGTDVPHWAVRPTKTKDLSPDQHAALSGVRAWLDRGTGAKRTLTLAGFGGTGKSYILSVLAQELDGSSLAFCAFTGKASSVLARKLAQAGVKTVSRAVPRDEGGIARYEVRPYCGTIHGLVYRPCPVCMIDNTTVEPEHTKTAGCREDLGAPDIAKKVMVVSCPACLAPPVPPPKPILSSCGTCNNARYLRRDKLDRNYSLIIVDEASMVSDDILETLLRHGVPLLAVGDHGQLPPVRGAGSLMRAPDLRLEKIHRQAEGNPIIQLSKRIRETGDIADELEDGQFFTILARRKLEDWIATRFPASRLERDPCAPESVLGTVLVSWTNRLRCSLNYDVRAALGTTDEPPTKGEVVVCLKNTPPVYNGMRAILENDGVRSGGGKTPKVAADLWFAEDGIRNAGTLMSEFQFFEEKTIDFDKVKEMGVSFAALGGLYDFGYALTCHKMQGSQAADVGVVLEPSMYRVMSREDRTRWMYTAATRAERTLTVFR
jgi:exodeoxyribonuclease-5